MKNNPPKFGYKALTQKGKLYKVDANFRFTDNQYLNFNKSNLKHDINYSLFKFRYLSKEYAMRKYTALVSEMLLKDSSSVIEIFDDLDIKINDKIETIDGNSGIVFGDIIVNSEFSFSGKNKIKSYIVTFG